jgi:diguanylate cyclase (GGDEF)-like protein/PAS domain S-box-containing protein
MKRIAWWLAVLGLCVHTAALPAETLKIGIYDDAPTLFINSSGQPAGLLVDVLQQLASTERWTLQYVPCQWSDCLAMLARGELDLLPDVAYSDERSARFDFHRVPVLYSWSQVYARRGTDIKSILDLKDKRVAVLGSSIQHSFMTALLRGFGLNTVLVLAPSQDAAFTLVDRRQADAVVSGQYYGDLRARRSRLVATPVIFQPLRMYFAVGKGRHREVLAAIDRDLAAWQADPGSVYYRILRRWKAPGVQATPAWVWWTVATVAAMLASALLAAAWLRRQVAARTGELRESERKLSTILDSVESLIYIKDTRYRYQYVNGAMCRLLGRPSSEIVGKDDFQLFDTAAATALHEADRKVIERGERVSTEEVKGVESGSLFLSTKIPLCRADGRVYALCGISIDITERKQVEESLRIAATVFQSTEGMFVLGPDRRIIEVNRAYSAMSGHAPPEMAGAALPAFSLEPDGAAFNEAMWEIVARNGKWQGEVWTRRKDGEAYPAWMTLTSVPGDDGQGSGFVGTQSDITYQKRAQDQIVQLAYYDALTGLPNRLLLLQRIRHCMSFNHRSKQMAALLVLDLDNFKDLNDTRGHATGDQLLQQVAERIVACARETDTVARLGGDEFVILVEAVGGSQQEAVAHADAIGWKILEAVGEPYVIGGAPQHTTCSIGVVLCGDDEVSIEELMKRADLAMYEAKKAGRNTLRFFRTEMESLVTYRTALEAELRTALRLSQFVLFYQGQFDRAGQMIGAEALLRWRHPQRGLIGPDRFIGIAENSGLILPLGRWVLESACAQLARWTPRLNGTPLSLAVNVSARQFLEPEFVPQTLAIIGASGADPACLKLELTESLLIEHVEETIAKMRALKEHGLCFSLDDFGTGYSSLSYLKRLPLDQLKIDRSFVRDVLVDPNDASIAQSVVALGKALGLGIIAEGVETEAQRVFLAEIGCDRYQGYLFGYPVEAEQLEPLMPA